MEEEKFLAESLNFAIDYVAIKEKIKGDQKDDTPDSGVIILCTRKDGTGDYAIATNQLTYLLNDDGKTIERLM